MTGAQFNKSTTKYFQLEIVTNHLEFLVIEMFGLLFLFTARFLEAN